MGLYSGFYQRDRAAAKIVKPIFIVGTGRCGSTILHQIFAQHPQVAFLSRLCQFDHTGADYNRWAMRLLDVPVLGRLVRRRLWPVEPYAFWEHHARGLSEPCRDLDASDVRPETKQHLRRILASMLTKKRQRMLVKFTGWPRLGYLAEIFPDARFVHIIRDGRSVANSLLEVDFWDGYRGPTQWRRGELTRDQKAAWERSGRSFVTLAGIEWKILMDAFETAKRRIDPAQYLEVRYEHFAADPIALCRQILDFCNLERSPSFERTVAGIPIRSTNFKWKEQLTAEQQQLLNDCLHDYLIRYGYENGDVDWRGGSEKLSRCSVVASQAAAMRVD